MSQRSWSVWMSSGLLSQRTRVHRGKRSECREANVLLMMVRTSAWICTGQRSGNQAQSAACVHEPAWMAQTCLFAPLVMP